MSDEMQMPTPPAGGKGDDKDLASSYVMAQINQSFKSDRIFHGIVSSKQEFRNLLGLIGKVNFQSRGQITRNLGGVIDLNPRLLQDTKVFEAINTILKNVPTTDKSFTDISTKILLKIREALIKNRQALDLSNPIMMEYSEVIRKFMAMVAPKIKTDFMNSLDEEILNFIMGKIVRERPQVSVEDLDNPEQPEDSLFDDEEEEMTQEERSQSRMQKLVKLIFSDVMRLEPELVSAVIMSLITQLPHGNMIIEDQALVNKWLKTLK